MHSQRGFGEVTDSWGAIPKCATKRRGLVKRGHWGVTWQSSLPPQLVPFPPAAWPPRCELLSSGKPFLPRCFCPGVSQKPLENVSQKKKSSSSLSCRCWVFCPRTTKETKTVTQRSSFSINIFQISNHCPWNLVVHFLSNVLSPPSETTEHMRQHRHRCSRQSSELVVTSMAKELKKTMYK